MKSSVISRVGYFITIVARMCESEEQVSEIWRIYQKRTHYLVVFMGEDSEAEMSITTNPRRTFLKWEWFNIEVEFTSNVPQSVLLNVAKLHSTTSKAHLEFEIM